MKKKLVILIITLTVFVGTFIVAPSFAYGLSNSSSIERSLTNQQIIPIFQGTYFRTYLLEMVKVAEEEKEEEPTLDIESEFLYTAAEFKYHGVIYYENWKWTWYSQKVLPGEGLDIPGRHVDSNGYICDENGYICLASSSLSKGTVINTPFGKKGKIYDCGCAVNVIDVYTNF